MRARTLVATVLLGPMALAPIGGSSAATKPERGYITDALTLPVTGLQVNQFGRDIDGSGDKDNKLGQVFSDLAGLGLDLTGQMDVDITSGDIVMLHSLRTFSLNNTKNATWQVWFGAPTPDPDLSGEGTFELPTNQPHSEKLAATIKNHHVKTVAGKIPVRLDIGNGPFLVRMTKAKVFATCFKAGCSDGRINGAVSVQQIEAKFYPQIHEFALAAVAEDCPGPDVTSCVDGSAGQTVLDLFDEDENFEITLVEISESTLIQTLFRPDLNLVKGDGGADDSLSFGFGFSTVKATLTRP